MIFIFKVIRSILKKFNILILYIVYMHFMILNFEVSIIEMKRFFNINVNNSINLIHNFLEFEFIKLNKEIIIILIIIACDYHFEMFIYKVNNIILIRLFINDQNDSFKKSLKVYNFYFNVVNTKML